MKIEYLEAIKKFEGFTAKAKHDYSQYSNGYGTRAQFPGEVIDKAEAERRFAAEISEAKAAVVKFAPHLDEGTTAALTSLTFNAGPGWMRAGLGAAIKNGDLNEAKQIFAQYVHAGGQRLAGLEARRVAELQWFGAVPAAGQVQDVPFEKPLQQQSAPIVSAAPETPSSAARGQIIASAPVSSSGNDHARISEDQLYQKLLLETLAASFNVRRNREGRDEREGSAALA